MLTRNDKTVIAGSINSFEKLDLMSKIRPWGFTMGSALFEKKFVEEGAFAQYLECVVQYSDTID
jgi:phosphoribosylformimino-5-aminoimidazole carboxamide ribonucleotide (ProFAR) isomerase